MPDRLSGIIEDFGILLLKGLPPSRQFLLKLHPPGVITALGALCYALWSGCKTLTYGDCVADYPSLIVVVLLFGGIQLTTIEVIGE